MILDEAIRHSEKIAENLNEKATMLFEAQCIKESRECIECSKEHRQLADWLKELKAYRNKSEILASCGDAVSREAVIEWLVDRTEIYDEMGNFVSADKVRKKCEDMISELPSVNSQLIQCSDAISRTHFDERVRIAGGMVADELSDDYKDGILSVLELLKTEPSVQPAACIANVNFDKEQLKKIVQDGIVGILPQQSWQNVIYSGDGYYDGQPVYDMANCPHCDYEYEEDDKDWGMPYCPNCGTRLNWEVGE